MDNCSQKEFQSALHVSSEPPGEFPSALHVSTQTQIGRINATIKLSELARVLDTSSNILYVEYGDGIKKGTDAKKSLRKHKKKKEKKYFYNQVTIHMPRESGKRVNMKIFNNGRVQMTGVIKSEQGLEKIYDFVQELNHISEEDRIKIFGHSNPIDHLQETETVLINSNFDIGFEIDVGPLFETPKEVADKAIKGSSDIVAASSLAAGHLTLIPKLRDELDAVEGDKVHIIVGGVIPKEDHSILLDSGASAVFATGTNIVTSAVEMLDILEFSTNQ